MNNTTTSDLVVLILSSLCLCFIIAVIKIFHQIWWVPTRLQNELRHRGIKGPNYKLIHGNTKEIIAMQREALSKPMDLSDHNVFARLQPHIHRWTNLYGKSYLQWDGTQAEVVVTELDLVKEILSDNDGRFGKGTIKPFFRSLLGDGLVVSNGEKWAKVRKLANYAFHADSLKRMIPAMIESTETLMEKWNHNEIKEIEVWEEFRLLTAEVISKTAFGSSYKEGQQIFELLTKLIMLTSLNFYKQPIPIFNKIFKTDDDIESKKLEKEVHTIIVELIRKREGAATNDDYGSDFLGLLVKAHRDSDENKRLSVENVVDECKTFYIAGQDTTNNLLAWTMLLLAVHEDWQEKARKEVLDLFGKQNPNPNDLSKLKIMGMIINESLRLYPPVVSMSRQVNKEVRLGNFSLPKNVKLFISNPAMHHDPQVWGQEAHKFNPERFSEGVVGATKNKIAAFLPFGIGPRTCVGFNFAIAEAKVALAMIVQRYNFTLSPAYVHSPVQVVTNRPQYGIHVKLSSL